MTETPKCTSWLGHKFRPRYSKSPAVGHGKLSLGWADAEAVALVLDGYRTITYVCDICVRCGHVIEQKPPENATKPTI